CWQCERRNPSSSATMTNFWRGLRAPAMRRWCGSKKNRRGVSLSSASPSLRTGARSSTRRRARSSRAWWWLSWPERRSTSKWRWITDGVRFPACSSAATQGSHRHHRSERQRQDLHGAADCEGLGRSERTHRGHRYRKLLVVFVRRPVRFRRAEPGDVLTADLHGGDPGRGGRWLRRAYH